MSRIRMKPEDREDSKRIKERDGYMCVRCAVEELPNAGGEVDPRGLHVHHIHTRSIQATRHNDDNLITLCYGCHTFLHSHPAAAHEFYAKWLGQERFEALADRAYGKRDR